MCSSGWECLDFFGTYECEDYADPILIDLSGAGFFLTDVQHGVPFDFFGRGTPLQLAWTAAGTQNGWLVLDRNHDGKVDNGQELFGNAMPQPGLAVNRLGFKALAQFDSQEYGGNRDGVIDENDAIFSRLFIWVDRNHNGISEPSELLTLKQAGVKAISLRYQDSHYNDSFGNQFRYRAEVSWDNTKAAGSNWAYDVILTSSGIPKKAGGH